MSDEVTLKIQSMYYKNFICSGHQKLGVPGFSEVPNFGFDPDNKNQAQNTP